MDDQVELSAASRPRRFGRPFALFLILLISLAAGGLYVSTAVLVHVDNAILPGVDWNLPGPFAKAPGLNATPTDGAPGTTRINVLILGIDRRPHHDPAVDGAPNSDSIHLLSLDPVTKTASMLALPRDLYIEMPHPEKQGEFIEGRVNSAYKLGEETKYPGGGAAFAKRVIENTFHLPVDYYAVVDWVAFASVIDALGGVWITVPDEMTGVEGFNPKDGNAFKITIPAGTQYMDSITALAYARFRDDEQNDFGRIRRQQDVMRSAADEALRRGWGTQGPQLFGQFKEAVNTDISRVRAPGLLNLAKMIGLDRVKMVSLAGENTEAVQRVITPRGEDVLVPNWEELSAIIRANYEDRLLIAEGASVTVVNATGARGEDERAVAYLRRFLLPPEAITLAGAAASSGAVTSTPATGQAPGTATAAPASAALGTVTDQTTITYTGNASETAKRVASWLGVPSARVSAIETFAGAPATVQVTLGKDVRLPDDERFHRYRSR